MRLCPSLLNTSNSFEPLDPCTWYVKQGDGALVPVKRSRTPV